MCARFTLDCDCVIMVYTVRCYIALRASDQVGSVNRGKLVQVFLTNFVDITAKLFTVLSSLKR